MGLKSFKAEWLARRAGRRGIRSDLPRTARDIVGPTGWMWSKGWDELAKHESTYARSFDPKVPRSIFATRQGQGLHDIPIPLVERLISEHGRDESSKSDR